MAKNVIGECHTTSGNQDGKHSCGYYDKVAYENYKGSKYYDGSESGTYLKTDKFHVGVSITRHKRYIEDKYVK